MELRRIFPHGVKQFSRIIRSVLESDRQHIHSLADVVNNSVVFHGRQSSRQFLILRSEHIGHGHHLLGDCLLLFNRHVFRPFDVLNECDDRRRTVTQTLPESICVKILSDGLEFLCLLCCQSQLTLYRHQVIFGIVCVFCNCCRHSCNSGRYSRHFLSETLHLCSRRIASGRKFFKFIIF